MKKNYCTLCSTSEKTILITQSFKDDYLDLVDSSYQNNERFIVKCDKCGFLYRDPILDSNELEKLYFNFRDSNFRNESPDDYFDRITGLSPQESENFARVNWIKSRLSSRLSEKGSIYDIGCGGGVFLWTFCNMNPKWQAFGVEPTPSFAKLAERRLSRPIIEGSYLSGLFKYKFDLITLNHVLEHVENPVNFLKEIKRDLNPEGYLYIEIPDILDFTSLPYNHDRFMVQHLSFFSKDTIRVACEKAGFTVLEIYQLLTLRKKNNLVVLCKNGD